MLNFIKQKYDQKKFLEFIQSKIDLFEKNYQDLTEVEKHKNIKKSNFLGSVDLDDGELGVFEFELTDNTDIENNRVSINTFLKKKVTDNILKGAIAVFYNPNKSVWRLSFVKIDYDDNLKEFATPPTRASFILGENVPLKTVKIQLNQISKSIESINSAFSVEPVSKEFFKEYKNLYKILCEDIATYPSNHNFEDLATISFFVKKLLGRIVFLFFLQKKGWLGATDNTWTDGDRKFLVNLFKDYKKNKNATNFYNDLLAPLFFDALNTDRRQAENRDYFDVLDCKIPYLNGGLFTKDKRDIKLVENSIKIEDEIFEKIFELFSNYNFTIIENSPEDVDIAIDPEMLGKVFEDLLEDRKQKGAFYTPREIVHYMCQQSLINYLKGIFTANENEQDIKDLVLHKKTDNNKLIKSLAIEVKQALQDIKVLDPAIGSGAFPMGMLHEIVSALHCIDKSINIAEIKKQVIQNSIYGVDIEESAVEIAKLRFWLSIVVDSDKPELLPNLFYKIMVGNSLLETINGYDPIGNRQSSIVREIQADIKEYYNCDDNNAKDDIKDRIHANLDKVISNKLNDKIKQFNDNAKNSFLDDTKAKQKEREKLSQDADLCQKILKDFKNHDYTTTELFFYKIYFADVLDNGGFDVVIANPPYIKENKNKSAFKGTYDMECYKGNLDIWYLFGCKSIDLLKEQGILCFIAQNNWVTSFGASKFRNKVLEKTRMLEFIDFGSQMIFDTASIQTMIMFLRKENITDEYICQYSKINKKIDKKDIHKFLNKQNLGDFDIYESNIEPINLINKNITFLNATLSRVINKVKAQQNIYLDDRKEITNGVQVQQESVNKKSLEKLGKGYRLNEGIFNLTTQEKEELSLNDNELELIKPLYTSEQVDRYFTHNKNSLWVIYTDSKFKYAENIEPYPNIKNHLDRFQKVITTHNKPYGIHRARNESFFKGEKILSLRKCVDRPVFSYVKFDSYVNQAFYVIKTNRISLKYLTLLLNSKLITFWLKYKGKMQGSNYQIDKEPILEIPIKNIQNTNFFEQKADEILKAKEQGLDTTKLEVEVDQMVYKLYELTDDEIAIVEKSVQ